MVFNIPVEKQCFKCKKTKTLALFYKHSQMKDGHLNKCIECAKKDVAKHREENIEKIRAYDRKRGSRQSRESLQKYRAENPAKYRATSMVSNAIRAGKLFREPCEICGREDTHAHHDDYAKPLNVRWLCPPHHFEWHKKHGEGLNAKKPA